MPLHLPRISLDPALLLASLLASNIPMLLAYNPPPSPSVLNQCLAFALWGAVAAMAFAPIDAPRKLCAQTAALMAAIGSVGLGVLGSWGLGSLPLSLTLSALGMLTGAALLAVSGASASRGSNGPAAFAALAVGLLVTGLASSAVGLIQVFAPEWTDGKWIASSNVAGRAVGNLRQPNHLSDLLLWALVAAVALHELRWLPRAGLWAVALPLVWVMELTHSRSGALGLLLLLAWALADRHLSRAARWLLAATPLLYGLAYGSTAMLGRIGRQLSAASELPAMKTINVGEVDSRLTVWHDAIQMIAAQPWFGIGFGEFNLAWTLSKFAVRPREFFDHAHNLFLHLSVELGLPLAALVITMLVVALRQGLQRARRASGDAGLVARAGMMILATTALHSMVELPLWYGYFLLPAALVWGLVLGTPNDATEDAKLHRPVEPKTKPLSATWGLAAGLMMSLAGAWSLIDYVLITRIYSRGYTSAELGALVERGQRSLFFSHFADYTAAANTAGNSQASIELGFDRTKHKMVDPLLMVNWSLRLEAQGRVDEARWIAQRLRDFNRPEAGSFFAPCQDPNSTAFQCQWPVADHSWREFAQTSAHAASPGRPASLGTAASPISAEAPTSTASR